MAQHFIYGTPQVGRDAMAVVAALHDVPVVVIHMTDRRRFNTELRAMIVGLLDGFAPEISTTAIGRMLGRDHSTVVYLLGRHRELIGHGDAYIDRMEAARMAMVALGYHWHGPSKRRGLDMDLRRDRRWVKRYLPAARQSA